MWVRLPPESQIGYAGIRGENMPQGAFVPNLMVRLYLMLQYPIQNRSGSTT